ALAALSVFGCAALGVGDKDPARTELHRLEREQQAQAAKERAVEDSEQRERAKHPETMEERLAAGGKRPAGGHLAGALGDYAQAYNLNPKAAAPRERLGYVHLRENPERAQPLFESALELEPNSVSGHIGLGLSLLAGGNRDEGLKHLQRAVEI